MLEVQTTHSLSASALCHWLVFAITFSECQQYSCAFGDCGDSVTETYLAGLLKTNVNNFVPSAYFEGSSTKFISTHETTVDHRLLCVDGGTSYDGEISLYDDGSHGDDFANDGVYSRGCVHYCSENVDLDDIFGYAMEYNVADSRLIVVDASLKGTVPYETLDTPLTPGATAVASSHAFFFADHDRKYYPDIPVSDRPNGMAGPTGKSVPVAALLQVFGDVFDFITHSPLEQSKGFISGAGIYKWQFWDRRAGPSPQAALGKIDACSIALNGLPVTRLVGVMTNSDIIGWDAILHELLHGTSGFEYHNALDPDRTGDKVRSGDRMHFPGACTGDHSSQQAPVWDWVKGYPEGIQATNRDEGNYKGVRLLANQDCDDCMDNMLTDCCSFRYEDYPFTAEKKIANPDLCTASPLMLYIAGIIDAKSIPKKQKTFYCMGSNTDGGCGTGDGMKPCTVAVDDSDRSRVTSDYVKRFTLDDLVKANGGKRYPAKKFNTIRHAAVHVSTRAPSEAEIVFYTLLWRHFEVGTQPHERVSGPGMGYKDPIETWNFHTGGKSILHSRLHGIDCGTDTISVPSCGSGEDVCKDAPCGDGAICKNLDGKPLCTCRDGYVGDGLVCAFAAETVSYKYQGTAYDLDSSCFPDGNVWTSFIPKNMLPVYPGGAPPYSAYSCGSTVCAPGWKCNKNSSTCTPPTGKDMCEGQNYSKSQCTAIGCCKFKSGVCKKKKKTCPPPTMPNTGTEWSCSNKNTCCYWPCDRLTFDNDEQIGQAGNCGYDCTAGIAPDVNGVIHPELYLWPNVYITNGAFHGYSSTDGPLDIEGSNTNMFDRCYDSCFSGDGGGSQNENAKFLLKLNKKGNMIIKTCKWLDKKKDKHIKKFCTSNKHNLSKGGYKPAFEVCMGSCGRYMSEIRPGNTTSKRVNMSKNIEETSKHE